MPAPSPATPAASRLADPLVAHDLLMYRLNRLLAVAGSLVVRLCEGGYGITRREWGLLMVLAQHPGLPPAELALRLGLDRARTSRAITSLLAKKLLIREAMPGDRRQAVLSLTPSGQAVHDGLFPQVKALNQELLAGLDAHAVQSLDQALADMQQRAEALVATRTDVPRTYRLRGGRHTD
ncbi:MarR family transcriptional regulator [Acidovorax sp. Leaf76]|nr:MULTISPECIES: MarR family transcriptional regulator [unclassified Acidovorax]KQS27461.1 MarR family transcriptional regulator [Acidovorax sp. Leaf191]RZJ58775.1 MAG: MarR family transcriptional regulator [Acidovorax sp.]KQO13920.1 MarR family transcriptional regulator [Acidovorax sp. Leaf76]KQO15593.1 MarR family transcriptional regulator [Acidovorax sp. Leaf78]KQO31441.1 MarR family transcriptional regulator [Acidovorax sp. Leaf84]